MSSQCAKYSDSYSYDHKEWLVVHRITTCIVKYCVLTCMLSGKEKSGAFQTRIEHCIMLHNPITSARQHSSYVIVWR